MSEHSSKPPRDTLNNFRKMIGDGQLKEILKVLRRRTINSLRFVVRRVLRSLGIYYDSPWVRKRLLKRLLERYYSWSDQDRFKNPIRLSLIVNGGETYPYSSTFIRLLSPLTDPSVKGRLHLQLYDSNTTEMAEADICVVQRTAVNNLAAAKKLVSNLTRSGTRLVVDTDDAFQLIDPEHPERNLHGSALEAFNYLINHADRVWVSTEKLKSSFRQLKGRVVVAPNTLDPRVWRPDVTGEPIPPNAPLQMIYMGTVSHDADWDMIFPVLEKLADDKPGSFELSIIGVSRDRPERPWIKRLYQGHNGSIYPRFVGWFLKQGPFDIGLSPLKDTEFNRNKSDIKCLDYLAAGVLPVVSEVEPYRNRELDDFIVRVKNTPEDWYQQLAELINDADGLRARKQKLIPKAHGYLWGERSSGKAARILLENLEKLAAQINT